MKRIFRTAALIMALIMSISVMCIPVSAMKKLTANDFVHTDGQYIIGTDGKIITLRGMALGNSVYNNSPLPDKNHHNENTYKELSSMGFNCVRFYLNYRIFEDDSRPYKYKKSGFEWLDKNVKWAKKHGIGIIFNMHYPQGGYQSQGNGLELWSDKMNQDRLSALWKAIAKRYRNEPTVWGYSLVNEPVVPFTKDEETSYDKFNKVMQRLAKDVRKTAPYQMIIVEGVGSYRDPESGKFTYISDDPDKRFPKINDDNVIYEFHNYNPFSFTHQNADWAGTAGSSCSYPSDDICSYDEINGWTGCLTSSFVSYGNNSWKYFESKCASLSDKSNAVCPAVNAANLGRDGSAYFDDIVLTEISRNGNRKVICRLNFNDSIDGVYAWSADGSGTIEHCGDLGYSENGCLKISGTTSDFTASVKRFEMKKDCTYIISGYIKSELNTPTIRMEFSKLENIKRCDKDFLEASFIPYVEFSRRKNVPVYLGEFGVIYSGFKENRGGTEWVKDMMEICQKYNIGYNYHAYNEFNFGLYESYPNGKNKELASVFKEYNKKTIELTEKLNNKP